MLLRRPALALALMAAALLAPSLLLGAMVSHSLPQNIAWASEFAGQFRTGILYPRWLPQSFEGLGAPTFYFYPPLAFWLDGVVSLFARDWLPIEYRLAVDSLVLLWASGLAMYLWLEEAAAGPRAAFWGAIGYMAAPYHLIDHYTRGAFAEFTAYAVLPLLVLALARLARGRRHAGILLAAAYAALLLSHLPTALLVSFTVLPPYVLFRASQLKRANALSFLLRSLAGGALGIGLATLYVLPALSLQVAISAEQLWTPGYDPRNWFLLMPERWNQTQTYMMLMIVAGSTTCFVACVASLVALRSRRPAQREPLFWGVLCLIEIVLMSGLVPWFWTMVPMVSKVQFPWRLLVVAEFATVSALFFVPWKALGRPALLLFALAALALLSCVWIDGYDVANRVALTLKGVPPPPPQDVKEYLPAGYPIEANGGYRRLGLEPVKDLPEIACVPLPRACRSRSTSRGDMVIEVEADQPTRVTLRRFFFPAWRLDPPLALVPTEATRLVSFTAGPGEHTYLLTLGALPAEQWGRAMSGASLVLLGLWGLISRSSARRETR